MTVTTDTIIALSPYVVITDYTNTEFATYKTWAEKRYARDTQDWDPGLESDEADQAVGLLICHYIKTYKKNAGNDLKSESAGDYSYTRGDSGYLERYKELLQSYLDQHPPLLKTRGPQPTRGVQRADMESSRAFQLSENQVPRMRYTDSGLKKPYD